MLTTARKWLAAFLLVGSAIAQTQPAPPPAATPLTLPQAVDIALEKNPARKAALAEQSMAEAGVREARSALLPRLTFSETATRGNDPPASGITCDRRSLTEKGRPALGPAARA